MDCQEEYNLFYYPYDNVFTDGYGDVVYDIFRIISPNTLYLFKEYKEDMLAHTIDGGRIALFYQRDEEMSQ
jgi:hypothetical protein